MGQSFWRRLQIWRRLDLLEQQQEKLMADFTALNLIAGRLVTDFGTLNTDVTQYIAAHPPANADEQAKVDAITASLTSIDNGVNQLDAATKPAPTPQPTAEKKT